MTVTGTLRRMIGWLFLLGAAGLLAELLLLEHTESLIQLSPFIVVGAGSAAICWAMARPGRGALWAVRVTGVAIAIVGALGVWYHYDANTEFEREAYPDRRGAELVWESLHGATPALAPGLMVQLGLLGLAFTYRHPAVRGGDHAGGDA